MNFNTKRLLILFSVALNIGFLLTAVVLWYNHVSPTQRHWREINEALTSLNLPADQEQAALEEIKRFRSTMESQITAIKNARREIMVFLARPGQVDQEEFNRLVLKANRMATEQDEAIVQHFGNLRRRLGDEQGAAFFSAMLQQFNNNKHHR